MRVWSLLVAATLATGCSFRYEPTASSSVVEATLLSETARAAGALGVRVHGEITDTISKAQQVAGQEDPTGWYSGGVAWYYRPQVARFVSIEPEGGHETARNVAGHEVCHAISSFHDVTHWECMARVAAPTYPRPGVGAVPGAACFSFSLDAPGAPGVH